MAPRMTPSNRKPAASNTACCASLHAHDGGATIGVLEPAAPVAGARAGAEAEIGWTPPFEMPGSAGTGAHARAVVGSSVGFNGADSDKPAAAALTQMTKVSRLSENFSMVAPGAPPEARAEYRRLFWLCRKRTNQLGVRQTVVDGDEESSSFGPIVATDGSQCLALAVRDSAGSLQPGAATSSASAPASAAGTAAARNSETIDPDSSAEFGTPRASFDHEPLGTASDGILPLPRRQCFRWWKATPRFDGTARAQVSDRLDQVDADAGFDTKGFQVYHESVAQRIEQAFTQYSEARGPPFFHHVMQSYAYGPVEEKIDFVDWTVTCSVTRVDRHLGAKGPLRPSSGQLEPASSKSCVVSLRRQVYGVPICTQAVDSEPVDNQQEQQAQRKQETVADGLKLWCRLNQNGELETIPGACKDGYAGLDNNEVGSSGIAVNHEAPHFLVAVQLGKCDWGVRLLPQRDDGTVGCAAHLRWEFRNDRLYSLAISDQLAALSSADAYLSAATATPLSQPVVTETAARTNRLPGSVRASGTQLSAEMLAEVEVLPLEIHVSTPVPVRWTRGHQEDEREPKQDVELRLTPKRASNPSSASGNPAFHQSDNTASSTSSTLSPVAATVPQDSTLSVLDRWSVKDENDGEQVLRANVRLLWRSTDYIAHRRVICVPPISHIKTAALEVWDDPNSISCKERCSAIQAVVAELAYREQPLSDTAEILAKRAHFLAQVGRYRQAEKLYRTAVAELLQRIGPHRTTASAERTHRRSSSLGSNPTGPATAMHPSKRALYDAVRERRSELGAVNAFIGNAQAAAQRRYGVSWVNRAAESELQQATVKADASADAQERCELLHRGLLACVEHHRSDQVRRDEGRRAGGDTNDAGSSRRNRQISNSYLEDAKDNQDALLADKVSEREPLVLRKNIEIWEFKTQQHDSLAIFAHPATGVPYLGDACKFMVEEPKECKEMQEREQSCRNLNFSHVRKVEIGPVRCDKHGTSEYITLHWMDQDNAGWEKLLKTLYWLTLATDDATAEGTMSRSDGKSLDAATATEMIANDILLCDETKVSFTVPPAEAGDNGSFHLRVRFGQRNHWLGQGWTWEEDDETRPDGWFNPLTHRDGYFFSPKFRRADMAKTVLPPPVVLDEEWENSNIDSQVARPESTPGAAVSACANENHADGRVYRAYGAGSLRIYTLSGLQASTTSIMAKKGLGFGESMVEIQYARVRNRDTGNVLSWEDAVRDEGLWSRALEYRVPEAPITTVIVNKAVDMMRHKGIPMIEAALISHIGQNKKKNTKVLKEFLEELWEKQLEPVYNYKIEPWLANKTLLRLLVTDTRGNALREATRNILRGLKVEIPPHLQRDRPCFETVTIQLLDKYNEPSDTVLHWRRHEDETRENSSMSESKRTDDIGVGGASAQRKPERARGDVPVLEAIIPSGSRFLVTASLGPSPWAYARQHWDPTSALVGVDSKTHMQNVEEQARLQRNTRQSVGTKSATTRGPSVSTHTALAVRNTPSAVVQSTTKTKLMSKDTATDLNPHAADQRDVIISGVFMRRKHAWLSGSPKRFFVQLLRRNRNALIDKDLMVGAGSTCKCTGGAFVLSPGSKGINSGKTYTFTPVVDVTTATTEFSTTPATPETVARLWAERLNEFIANDEKHPKTDYSLILRVIKPDSSISPDVAGKGHSAFADSRRSSLNENDLELTQQRSRSSRAASMNDAMLSDVAQITRSSPSLSLEPHDTARHSRTREECVRLAANYVHHHQLPEAIELVLHYMQLPRTSTPVSTPSVAAGSVTSIVGGTTAFVNQVLGAIEELEDTDTHHTTAKPMATACRALGQLLSTDPYNPQILRLLESLHAALMQHPSTQRKQQRRAGAGHSVSAHWATEPLSGPRVSTGVHKLTRLSFDDAENGPASSNDDIGGKEQFHSASVDGVSNNEGEDELLKLASSVRHAGDLGFQNEVIGEQEDPQAAYDQRNPHRNLQIWWRISASPDELLDLNDSSLLDRRKMGESKLLSLPGGRLHVRDSQNDPETCSVTSPAGKLRHATLYFRGTHKESDFACLSPGTEFTLQCQGLEEGAHELSELDIHIKVVQSSPAAADQLAGADEYKNSASSSTPVGSKPQADHNSTEEKQTKPKWPPVPLARPPSVTELVLQVRRTAEQALLQRLHRMYSYLDVPKTVRDDDGQLGWGSLKDSPSLHVVRTATEHFLYQQIIARLSKELPKTWRTDPKRVEQWRARHQQKLQASGDSVGSADMADLPLMTEAVGEVIKLRMVEWWQKSLSRYRSKQRATPAERREALEGKRTFISRILEDDSSAEARNVNVDLDAISEAETMDVLILVLKRVIKEEARDLIAEETAANKPKLVMALVLVMMLGFIYVMAMLLVLAWWNGSTPPDGYSVCHAQTVAEGAGADTDANDAVLATQTMSKTLVALARQLEAQSAEMRAMREAFAELQVHQSAAICDDAVKASNAIPDHAGAHEDL